MKHKVFFSINLIIFMFIINFICTTNTYGESDKHYNIIVINSYHRGLTWTEEETEGILNTVKSSNLKCTVYVEYMDWKSHPTTENLQLFYNNMKYKYSNIKTDLIVTTDDIALKFAFENRKQLFSDAPVVFCGVNHEGLEDTGKNYTNYTGVIEKIDPETTVELAIQMNPSLKNLYILYDTTESGISTGDLVIKAAKKIKPDLNIISLSNFSYDELIKITKAIRKDSAILFTTFYTDNKGAYMEFEDLSKLISNNSSVPLFHLYDFGLNNGAIGGSMLSGKLQGEEAGKIAIEILNGKAVSQIPILDTKTAKSIFDYNQLKKYNIPLKNLPKDIAIINKPFSFFETYRTLVLMVAGIFILLMLFIYILLIYIRRIKLYEYTLSNKNDELQAIYEQLYASDAELQSQYSELSETQKKLHELAYYDFLTGLPNKLYIKERLDETFNTYPIGNGAFIFIDADNFKLINDSLGHSFGDKLIRAIGLRLSSFVNEHCTLSRISGDEFVILIKNYVNMAYIKNIAECIIDSFKSPFIIESTSIVVSSSLGIALYPEQAKSADELLSNADIAMYEAKKKGKAQYSFYNMKMNEIITERLSVEKHLRNALANNELMIYYQPQINVNDNKISGFEALLRWNNPVLGFVTPQRFISVSEESRLIVPIGEWVLRESCKFIKNLNDNGYKYKIAVNISVLQLIQDNFTDIVLDALSSIKLSPEYLELEITESVLMESYDTVCAKIQYLKNQGIGIALDDFGQGYSSLNYLKQLPISTLKIDKDFIKNMSCSNIERILIGSIIHMGHSMGLNIVAEGVETSEQLEFLAKHNCDKIQGYYYSKPIAQADIIDYIKGFNLKSAYK